MHAERQAKMQEHINFLVSSGVITQEQADKKLEFMKSKHDSGKFEGKRGHGHGHFQK